MRDVFRSDQATKVLPFSKKYFALSTPKSQRKKRGEATSSRPSLPLLELCEGPTRSQVLLRCVDRLHRLDAEQIQVVEIIIAAIGRG